MDAIYPILKHAHSVNPGDLPPPLVETTKRFILDSIAVMLAGSRAAGCDQVVRYVSAWQGKPDAEVVGAGRSAMPYAALANSMMAHAVEFDDTYEPADVHALAVVLPAIFAAAELPGSRASGRDIIAACAIGADIAYRLGSTTKVYRGWHPTATCGIFGATAAAARIAGCNETQFHHAFGLAYSLTSGNFQAVVDGSLSKRMQPGFASRGAVEAVLLARAGLTGAVNILEGTFGYFTLYEAGDYKRDALLDGLGRVYLIEKGSMKPYPCCRFCHAAIDGVLAIRAEPSFPAAKDPAAIKRIDVEIPEETFDYVGKPYAPGDNPQVAAQFSVPFTVAAAFVQGKVGLDEFTLDAVRDNRVLDLAKRTTATAGKGLSRYGAVTVRVELASGKVFKKKIATMKGEPSNPLTNSELNAKALSCIRYGGFPDRANDALLEWTNTLDRQAEPLVGLHAIFRMRGNA